MLQNEDTLFRELESCGLHTRAGLNRLAGNKDLYLSLVNRFITEHSNEMDSLKTYLHNRDFEAAGRLIHTLRSVTGHIAADEIADKFKVLEHCLKSGTDAQCVENHIEELDRDYTTLLQKIRKISFIDSVARPVSASADESMTKEVFLSSLKELGEFISFHQPGDAQTLLDHLISLPFDLKYLDSLKKVRVLLQDYSFSDSLLLVQNLIETLSEE